MNGKIAWTHDEFSDGRDRSTRGVRSRFGLDRLPIAGVIIAGLVGAAVIGGIVTWLVSGDERQATNSPPLIKADEKPIKVYPQTPGGLEVPNRDKLVYSRLKDGSQTGGEVERLSPAPEEPMTPPTMLAKPAPEPAGPPSSRSPTGNPFPSDTMAPTDLSRSGQSEPVLAPPPEHPVAAVVKPVPTVPATKPAPAKPSQAEKPVQAEKPAAAKPTVTPPTPPPATAAPKRDATESGSSKLYVQLLAARSQSDVLDAWKNLQSKNGDLLGGLDGSVARADLGERGVYYRLRAGPITSEAKAKSLCSALADRKVSCLIVRAGA